MIISDELFSEFNGIRAAASHLHPPKFTYQDKRTDKKIKEPGNKNSQNKTTYTCDLLFDGPAPIIFSLKHTIKPGEPKPMQTPKASLESAVKNFGLKNYDLSPQKPPRQTISRPETHVLTSQGQGIPSSFSEIPFGEFILSQSLLLKEEWLQLLQESSLQELSSGVYSISKMLAFYQTAKNTFQICQQSFQNTYQKSYHSFSFQNTSHKMPSKLKKAYKNILWISKKLQNAAMGVINEMTTHKILETAENLYKERMKSREMQSFKINMESSKLFWESITSLLEEILNTAFDHIKERSSFSKLLTTSVTEQHEQIEILVNQIKHRTHLMIFLNDLARKTKSIFLRHFNPPKQAITKLAGLQCMGVVIDWGLTLTKHPLQSAHSASKYLLDFTEFLNTLQAEKLPSHWLFLETMVGEPICTHTTLNYQHQAFEIFNSAFLEQRDTKTCDAQEMIRRANLLFSSKKVSVITITLNTQEDAEHAPHMIGIARIKLPKNLKGTETTLYRFIDADYGEFEAYSILSLESLLVGFFKRLNYPVLYCNATLQNIDPALELIQEKGHALVKDCFSEESILENPSQKAARLG